MGAAAWSGVPTLVQKLQKEFKFQGISSISHLNGSNPPSMNNHLKLRIFSISAAGQELCEE